MKEKGAGERRREKERERERERVGREGAVVAQRKNRKKFPPTLRGCGGYTVAVITASDQGCSRICPVLARSHGERPV